MGQSLPLDGDETDLFRFRLVWSKVNKYYACGKKVKVDALECSLRLGVVRRQRLFPDPESGAR